MILQHSDCLDCLGYYIAEIAAFHFVYPADAYFIYHIGDEMQNLQDLCHHLQFLQLKTLNRWIHKNKGSGLSHTFLFVEATIRYIRWYERAYDGCMLFEYEALSILMHMEIFLSQILIYANDVLNTTIRRMYLQPYFHLAWFIQEEIVLLFHTCNRLTQIF